MKKTILSLLLTFTGIIMLAQGPQVKTKYGVLEGIDASGVKIFKGVPFAQPPVGDLRWKAPQPVQPWEGVRDAKTFGPNPMQEPVFGDMAFGTSEMSEDCLYLNIWTPAKTMSEQLPVLIYFNGGGLYAGSGSEPRYAGDAMARKGIISITANYREGIFGFFAHPELSKETAYKGSGNYGFLDQRAAIQWVKDNISAFGGDPNQITIVGESAGSMSVSAQMASPLNKGLFARAMASSGSVVGNAKIATLKEAEQKGTETMKALGCKNLKQLRDMPAEELLTKAAQRSASMYNIDGYFFTEQPYDTYKHGRQLSIPLLVGGNSEELPLATFLGGRPATLDNAKAACIMIWGDKGERLFDAYGFKTDADLSGELGMQLASDLFLSYTTWKFADMHKKTSGQPVYRYLYRHIRPAMRVQGRRAALAGGTVEADADAPQQPAALGAAHSADIEYAMGTLPTNRVFDWQPDDFTVSDIFSNYYANFVKTGNPNGLGLTEWTHSGSEAVAPVMQLGVDCHMKQNADKEARYATFDQIWWGE